MMAGFFQLLDLNMLSWMAALSIYLSNREAKKNSMDQFLSGLIDIISERIDDFFSVNFRNNNKRRKLVNS